MRKVVFFSLSSSPSSSPSSSSSSAAHPFLTEHDPVSMCLSLAGSWRGLASEELVEPCFAAHRGGGEGVNPANCGAVCSKCGVQQGGERDPSKFMPLCEGEEKGCGVSELEGRNNPFTFR